MSYFLIDMVVYSIFFSSCLLIVILLERSLYLILQFVVRLVCCVLEWRVKTEQKYVFQLIVVIYQQCVFSGCSPSSSPEILNTTDKLPLRSHSGRTFNYYPNNQDCHWLIIAPKNQQIEFKFQMVDLGQGDFIEIREHRNLSAPVLTKLSSKSTLNNTKWQWSSDRFLWVHFSSDEKDNGPGFTLRFRFKDRRDGKFVALCTVLCMFQIL